VVSFLWPRVGEVDVERFYGIIMNAVGDELGGVGAYYSHVFQAPSAYAVDGVPIVAVGPLDCEEVGLRLGLCLVEQECALSAAYLDVDIA